MKTGINRQFRLAVRPVGNIKGCVAKTGAADGRVTDVSAQPHLHAQIQPVQVASLPSFHHLIMCALVSELPTVLPTSSRDGE